MKLNFLDINNLELYDSLIKKFIDTYVSNKKINADNIIENTNKNFVTAEQIKKWDGSSVPTQHTHNATDITQDTAHKFVTESQINQWNNKATGNHNHDSVYAKITHNHQASEIVEDTNRKFVTQQNLDSINELLGSVKFCTVTYNSGANGTFGDGSTTLIKRALFSQSLPEFPVLNIDQGYEFIGWDTNDKDVVVDGIVNKDLVFDAKYIKKLPQTPQTCDYYFETRQDFDTRRDQILTENNNDLSQKTFGFGDGVTDLSSAFSSTMIESTPKLIFANNVTNFDNCFDNCTSLSSIHPNLFIKNVNASTFAGCFFGCGSLLSIPNKLFDNSLNATSFFRCFEKCSCLTTVSFNLFDKNINAITFTGCFTNCSSVETSLPDVWNKNKFPKVTNGSKYAEGCKRAANYNEIPSNFGGPYGNPTV